MNQPASIYLFLIQNTQLANTLQKCHFQKVQRKAKELFLIRDARQLTAVFDLGLDPGIQDAEWDGVDSAVNMFLEHLANFERRLCIR